MITDGEKRPVRERFDEINGQMTAGPGRPSSARDLPPAITRSRSERAFTGPPLIRRNAADAGSH
jgi:hypothetical protein